MVLVTPRASRCALLASVVTFGLSTANAQTLDVSDGTALAPVNVNVAAAEHKGRKAVLITGNWLKPGEAFEDGFALLKGVDFQDGIDRKPLGEIDFFGYRGFELSAIRSALPFHEGDSFPPAKAKSSDALKRQVSETVERVIGRPPTDVSFVCCDSKQNWMVYIGLPGESYRPLAFNPAQTGRVRLPKAALALRDEMDNAWMNAVMKGHATEDDSEGYALTNEPKARRAQLAIRDYALHNEALILEVLASSSDARHRATAAQMLGYARQSDQQVDALVRASLDANDDVRNDAVRALEVLAGAKPDVAKRIPAEPFVRLIRSGAWSDHNKASLVLLALTKTRDPNLLTLPRTDALDSLVEMARWRSAGHAEAALTIIGRIVGLSEDSLNTLIDAGEAETIISKLNRQ